MKLRANQLQSHFNGQQWMPLYIISGDEPLLTQEACDLVRQAARNKGFTEREVFQVETGFDWSDLLESANSMSLFGDRKLMELRFPKAKIDDKGKKALTAYMENPSPDNLLLIIFPKLEKRFTSTQWFKTLETQSALCQIWPIDEKQLPQWIRQRLTQAGYQPTNGAVELLAERVQGNLLAASQEVEKLTLFIEPGPIDEATIESCVSDHARYNIFDLVDQAVQGNLSQALKMLNFLKASGSEPTLVLWALAKELRTLESISYQVENGTPPAKAFRDNRVWDSRKPVLQKALGKLRSQDFQRGLNIASQADYSIKGLSQSNPWNHFEDILLTLAKKPVLGQLPN
ncbi:MAG: DNA polymerase III subunit delta [Pseudomonadales bacterium]|nr:DNA polymerase III subunit delta [Pseudomonadales bacterium]